MLGDRQRHVTPAVHDAEVALAGRDEVDGVPGLALGQGEDEVGMSETQASDGGSDQAPHRRGEGRDPQLARDGPGLSVQPRLDLLEVGQEPRSGIDEVAAVSGEHHPATDAFEQGNPRLLLEPLHLLGDRAGREAQCLGSVHDRSMVVDGA